MRNRGVTVSFWSLVVYSVLFYAFEKQGYRQVRPILNITFFIGFLGGIVAILDSASEMAKRRKKDTSHPDEE